MSFQEKNKKKKQKKKTLLYSSNFWNPKLDLVNINAYEIFENPIWVKIILSDGSRVC